MNIQEHFAGVLNHSLRNTFHILHLNFNKIFLTQIYFFFPPPSLNIPSLSRPTSLPLTKKKEPSIHFLSLLLPPPKLKPTLKILNITPTEFSRLPIPYVAYHHPTPSLKNATNATTTGKGNLHPQSPAQLGITVPWQIKELGLQVASCNLHFPPLYRIC